MENKKLTHQELSEKILEHTQEAQKYAHTSCLWAKKTLAILTKMRDLPDPNQLLGSDIFIEG